MEKEKNKKLSIILIGVSIGLVISIAGILVYKFYPRSDEVRKNGTVTKQLEVNHINEDAKTNTNDKVVLDEEDVKKWLDEHRLISYYYKENFDYATADNKAYSSFLGFNILFGGVIENAVENITLNNESYNFQYTYPIIFIKNILNDYFGVDIDKIDINIMNEQFKGTAEFSMDNSKFVVKVVATGLDPDNMMCELNNIYINNEKNIIVNYDEKDCTDFGQNNECQKVGNREIVLKKTNTGYNLLKAYKVEN